MKTWTVTELAREGAGWVGSIPCAALAVTGPLKYFAVATNADGEPIAHVGTASDPLRSDVARGAPAVALVGKRPPARCTPMVDDEPTRP